MTITPKPGWVYEIQSRNLRYGAYAPAFWGGGFIGIRIKFDYRYLDFEAFGGAGGTVSRIIREIGPLPEGIQVSERLGTGPTSIPNQPLFDYLDSIDPLTPEQAEYFKRAEMETAIEMALGGLDIADLKEVLSLIRLVTRRKEQ